MHENVMRILKVSLLFVILLPVGHSADQDEKRLVQVMVDFSSPSRFTDVEMGSVTTDSELKLVLDRIRAQFVKYSERSLPSGYLLTIVVNDIDLAGWYDPSSVRFDDVRIVTAAFPPRIRFGYAVHDDAEELIMEGSENLVDLAFLATELPIKGDGIAPHVSRLVREWTIHDLGEKYKNAR